MKFIVGIIGAIAGIWLFSSHSQFLVGAVLGVIVALLCKQVLNLWERINILEQQIQKQSGEVAKTQPAVESIAGIQPVADEQDDAGFTFEPEHEAESVVFSEERMPEESAASGNMFEPGGMAEEPSAAARINPPTGERSVREDAAHGAGRQVELWNIVVSYFTGGNVVVRAGVVVLFFGVAFLLKYSAERNLIPIEFRLLAVAAGAIALLLFGWRLRMKRTGYALILQGGAIGILYLTIFSALRLYHLLPVGLAMALLVGMSIFSAALAILQDARALAVIGVLGGFLAPILTSTGSGNHVMLFSYYALLNAGIVLIARYRSWRELNLLGFVFTFGIGTLWGSQNYSAELFASTEPFLLLFFLFYLSIGILFARNLPLPQKGFIDGTMVFGTPIVCFAMQSVLVKPYEYGLAWSALCLGLLYSGLAWGLYKKGSDAMRTMVESFLAMGVIFGTIAIPLALDGRWTATAWALEGSAIIWIAIKQKRWMPRVFGLILQPLAGLAFLGAVDQPAAQIYVLNSFYLGCLVLSFAGLFSGFCLNRSRESIASAQLESRLMLFWGLLWWFGAGVNEIVSFSTYTHQWVLLLCFVTISSVIAFVFGRKLSWPDLSQVYLGLFGVMLVAAGYVLLEFHSHPSIHGGFIAWPLAFAGHYWLLYQDNDGPFAHWHDYLHVGLFLLLVGLCTWEATWWADHLVRGSGVWSLVVLGMVPALFMFALCKFWDKMTWPLLGRQKAYLYHALLPVAAYLWLGLILTNLMSKGDPWPLPYLPFLNPFDLVQICVMLALAWWVVVLDQHLGIRLIGLERRQLIVIASATVFFWLNAVLIRTLHHWGGVSFDLKSMIASDLVQTSVSIFWTLTAMLIMLWGTSRKIRPIWMVGAGLIGVVIVKLFIFDLAHTSTIERIISFIVVGLLCLAIGYKAPLPARAVEKAGVECE